MQPTQIRNTASLRANIALLHLLLVFSCQVPMARAQLLGTFAIWHSQTGQIASAATPAIAGEALSMYTTNLVDGGVIPPQVTIGGRLAEVLYFGASGYPGFNQVNFRVPSGVAPGSAVSVRLNYIGRSSNEVTLGVR